MDCVVIILFPEFRVREVRLLLSCRRQSSLCAASRGSDKFLGSLIFLAPHGRPQVKYETVSSIVPHPARQKMPQIIFSCAGTVFWRLPPGRRPCRLFFQPCSTQKKVAVLICTLFSGFYCRSVRIIYTVTVFSTSTHPAIFPRILFFCFINRLWVFILPRDQLVVRLFLHSFLSVSLFIPICFYISFHIIVFGIDFMSAQRFYQKNGFSSAWLPCPL